SIGRKGVRCPEYADLVARSRLSIGRQGATSNRAKARSTIRGRKPRGSEIGIAGAGNLGGADEVRWGGTPRGRSVRTRSCALLPHSASSPPWPIRRPRVVEPDSERRAP